NLADRRRVAVVSYVHGQRHGHHVVVGGPQNVWRSCNISYGRRGNSSNRRLKIGTGKSQLCFITPTGGLYVDLLIKISRFDGTLSGEIDVLSVGRPRWRSTRPRSRIA